MVDEPHSALISRSGPDLEIRYTNYKEVILMLPCIVQKALIRVLDTWRILFLYYTVTVLNTGLKGTTQKYVGEL